MRIIYISFIPKDWFTIINLLGIWFVQKGCVLTDTMITHERIHNAQMKEMLYVLFYLWYVVEWAVKGFRYESISFEQEAYANEGDMDYPDYRGFWWWWKWL